MNKYVIAIIALGFSGYYGYKELKKNYKNLNSSKIQVPANIPKVNRVTKPGENPGEIFYSITLDRFADGDSGNNSNVDLSNPLGYHGGDLKGLTQKLDVIKDLGVSAILLNNLSKQTETIKKLAGQDFDYYPFNGKNAITLEEMDPHAGTFEDLLELVIKSHEKGLKVFVSLDLNGLEPNSPLINEPKYTGFFRDPSTTPSCDLKAPLTPKCSLFNKVDFIQEDPNVASYLNKVVKDKWARLGIDGLFLENAMGYDMVFLAELNKKLKKDFGPNFTIIPEFLNYKASELTRFQLQKKVDLKYDTTLGKDIFGYLNNDESADTLHNSLRYNFNSNSPSEGAVTIFKPSYMPNLFYRFFENVKLTNLAFTFHIALGTNPVIEFGEEVGKVDSGTPFVRTDYPWGDGKTGPGLFIKPNAEILKHYKKLIALKRQRNSYLSGYYAPAKFVSTPELFCFFKMKRGEDPSQQIYNSLSCFNRTSETVELKLDTTTFLKEWIGERGLTDFLSNKKYTVKDGEIVVPVASREAVIMAPL